MSSGTLILVVDDNPTNLKLISDVLEFEDYTIARAGNAEAALAQIASKLPALILMDIQMPGMDGLTLTRQLKADPATRSIPVIAVTSFAMKGDEAKAREAGCDGYITKPINTRELPHLVRRFLADGPEDSGKS